MTAIDYSVMYEIVGPDGTTVSFNDEADENFMGYLDEITGLDSPEVRENAQNNVAGDGGQHGNFYAGRRPFTMSGTIFPTVGSNTKQELLQAAVSRARTQDSVLSWTPTGEGEAKRMVKFRSQQPCRILGKVPKTFQVMGVSADFRVTSYDIQTTGVVHGGPPVVCTVVNAGNEEAPCMFLVQGSILDPVITNVVTGKQIAFYSGFFIPSLGTYPIGVMSVNIVPDLIPNPFRYNVSVGEVSGGIHDMYSAIDPLNTDWTIGAEPGTQTFTLSGTDQDGGTSMEVQWRDSWI